ncbi:MAG: DUF2062 domain-containing protein [Pikeienuella sp.]|uniref:DUF2062 domain-containing protein n=1 Tax=Pikeienuella sp. TaxID=2831957 RepID=UPI00391CE7C4
MLFKRRERRPFSEKVRAWIAPRRGWGRVIDYWRHRMQRLPDSPTRIAIGFACGVYTSFTPFFGFHFVVAAVLAWVLRGNILASAIGTFVGNPLTFPFIAAICIETGSLIMGGIPIDGIEDMPFTDMAILFLSNIEKLVLPYFVGGLAPGLAAAAASYFIVKPVVVRYQKRRRAKLMARAKARIEAAQRAPGAAE